MPKAEDKNCSPIHSAIKEADAYKKEVDEFVVTCERLFKGRSAADSNAEKIATIIKTLYNKSIELLAENKRLTLQANELKKENEPSKVMRFDSKKKDEIKRLDKLLEKVTKLSKQLEPDEVEEDYLKTHTGHAVSASEESSEYEDTDDDEDITEPKANMTKTKDNEKQASAAEESDYEDDSEEEEDESEEDGEEENPEEHESPKATTVSQTEHIPQMQQFVALMPFKAEETGDLSFETGDILTITNAREDGWLDAQDQHGNVGLVPSNYLKVYNRYEHEEQDGEESDSDDDDKTLKTPRSGRQLWKNIKRAVKETSVTDVLHAMGSVPAGFRDTTLGKLTAQDNYKMKFYLAPKLSPSGVSYKDLFFDTTTNKTRGRPVRIQRIVSVVVGRQIPVPGAGLEITSRHVRVCLFDWKNVLSNVHTIRLQGLDKDERIWTFNTKATENMKSLEFADFFVRTNSSDGNIGILFELGISYMRTSTGEKAEFSCGWVHLPLFDANGTPTQNKTYELTLNGGTPYEKGVDVDPSVGRRETSSTNLFRSLMSTKRQPRLTIRVQAPTKEQKDLLDTLPEICLSSTAYIQYISFYRQILTDAVIRDCIEPRSTELIHHPLLATFPSILDLPDLMDVLRAAWAERLKFAKRSDKKDPEALKQLFMRVYMDSVYPLYTAASIPPPLFGDHDREKDRYKEIRRLLNVSREIQAAVAMLLSADTAYKPFDTSELAFNIIGPHCVSR